MIYYAESLGCRQLERREPIFVNFLSHQALLNRMSEWLIITIQGKILIYLFRRRFSGKRPIKRRSSRDKSAVREASNWNSLARRAGVSFSSMQWRRKPFTDRGRGFTLDMVRSRIARLKNLLLHIELKVKLNLRKGNSFSRLATLS